MALSDSAIRKAKPADKPIRLFDGVGLYLEIFPSGGKLWRLKYRFAGKEKRLALGIYPDVHLPEDDVAIPIRPITGQHSLFPHSATRTSVGVPCGSLAHCSRRKYGLTVYRESNIRKV